MSGKRSEVLDESSIVIQSNERHKIAKKKRLLQLKRYNQYEKQLDKSSAKKSNHLSAKKSASNVAKEAQKEVRFVGRVRLLEAAARNDIEEVRQLLEAGVSPDVTNDDGLTAMHQCCIDNFEEMMCLLIQYGAKVNACDSELWTPLHAAAACGHLNLCKHLINNGADLMAVNCDGMMAYDICDNEATLDFIETEMTKRGITQQLIDETRNLRELNMLRDLKELVGRGFDVNCRGRNGETFLHIASCNGYLDVAQFLLLQPTVNINAVDNESWQATHCAVCWNQLGVLELLLAHGASLEARTKNGETALDICEDEELKQQILEMRDHWQRNKPVKTRDLVHKPSSVRSSSVRRSSMKQKKATSMKEALEEGKLLTIGSMATNPNNNNNSISIDDDNNDINPEDDSNRSSRTKSSFKDKTQSFTNRVPVTNELKVDSRESQVSSPESGNGLGETRKNVYNFDDGRANEEGDLALLGSERCPSYKAAEERSRGNPYTDNNDNNNIIRVGSALPSALKKTSQSLPSSSSSSSKSDGCCAIV